MFFFSDERRQDARVERGRAAAGLIVGEVLTGISRVAYEVVFRLEREFRAPFDAIIGRSRGSVCTCKGARRSGSGSGASSREDHR